MAANSQQSSLSSDSSFSSVIIVSSNAPVAERRARNTYACMHCDKTFPTAMALGGHQNAYRRLRALGKRPAETFFSHQRYPTINASYPSRLTFTNDQRIARELHESFGACNSALTTAPSVGASGIANSVPPAAGKSNTFFGVRDFFAASASALEAAPSVGASGTVNVIDLEDEGEEIEELDLELKL